ncbi:MAG: hypothetical protein NZ942_01770 [Candidatus Aenigmarchaeota archaeon]|nr:hypothetical protein [Candidatus Aenigmarchaeota archaeon]
MRKKEFLIFSFFLFFAVSFIASIIAIPFVNVPETFNESLVEISVFEVGQKVVIRVNVSDTENDTQFVWLNLTASNGTLIFLDEVMVNIASCGENCSTWEKNYTIAGGDPYGAWLVEVSANDTLGNIATNSTTFSVNKYLELIISQALVEGISFGLVVPMTSGKPALNNSNGGTQYYLTLGTSSNVKVDFYHRINETHPKIHLNESSSRISEVDGFSSLTTLTSTWKIMGNSSVNCSAISPGSSCWVKYFIDVEENVISQYFERRYCFCAVFEGGNPSLCGDC